MSEIKLSIIIPAFKEEKRIHKMMEAVEHYVQSKDFAVETLVVVDGSPDKTAEVAKSYQNKIANLRVLEDPRNKGKGGAVKDGVLAAKGKYVIFADADNSTPIEQVDKLLEHAEKHEVVIGSRYCDGGKLAIPQPLTRRIGSRVLNMIIQTLAIKGIRDTQCGFKLFELEAAKNIFSKMTIGNFSFDIELLVIAKRQGYKIKEVGITWYDNPNSRVNPIKDGLRMIQDSWQIRKNSVSGKYN